MRADTAESASVAGSRRARARMAVASLEGRVRGAGAGIGKGYPGPCGRGVGRSRAVVVIVRCPGCDGKAGTEMRTIGTEEHFVTDEVLAAWSRLESPAREDARAGAPPGEMGERLREVGERRIAAMDEAGLDVQVISLTSPGLHNLPADEAARLQVADERPHRRARERPAGPVPGLRHARDPGAGRGRAGARARGHTSSA